MIIHFWERFPSLYDWIQILATGGFLSKVSKDLQFLKKKSILDIGCGTGTLLEYIKPGSYLGIDINSDFINLAKKKYPGFNFKVLNIVDEKFPSGKFEYIFIMNVLHHLTDEQIKKMFKTIRKSKQMKEFVIVESKPANILGKILGRFDAGSNFREYDNLIQIIEKQFNIKSTRIITAPIGTYKYLIARCRRP